MIQNYEKLGAFYLGKEYDPATRTLKEDLILYDSKDLNTHAVIIGILVVGGQGAPEPLALDRPCIGGGVVLRRHHHQLHR